MDILLILLIVFFLVAAAYFSAVETAVLASSRLHLRSIAEKGNRRAELVLGFLEKPERFLTAILLGNNVSIIAGTAIVTALAEAYLPSYAATAVSSIGMTFLVVMFAEILPKSVTLHNPNYFAMEISRSINLLIYPVAPISWLFSKLASGFLRIFGVDRGNRLPFVSREELRRLLTDAASPEPSVSAERRMISRIFKFGETTVSQIMIPLVDVVSVNYNADTTELIKMVKEYGYSRFPVYEDRIDNVIGIVAVKDFIGNERNLKVQEKIRNANYVPETKSIQSLLPLLQQDTLNIAVVVDEYGGVVGLVTLEDIIEEIVGEIEGEYDRTQSKLISNGDTIEVDATYSINTFNENMPIQIPHEDYETLGGFIVKKLGRIPRRGEEFKCPPYTFVVLETTDRAVQRLKIIVSDSIESA